MCVHSLTGNKCNSETGQPSRGYFVPPVPSFPGFALQVSILFLWSRACPELGPCTPPGSLNSSALKGLQLPPKQRLKLCCQAILTAQQCLRHSLATPQPEFVISSRQGQEVIAAFPHLTTHNLASLRHTHWALTNTQLWFSPAPNRLPQFSPASHQSVSWSLAVPTMLNLL